MEDVCILPTPVVTNFYKRGAKDLTDEEIEDLDLIEIEVFRILNFEAQFHDDPRPFSKELRKTSSLTAKEYKANYAVKLGAIVIEPVMVPAGLATFRPEFIKKLRLWCTQHAVLLISDETFTTPLRTGLFHGHQHYEDMKPDYLVLGKGLGFAALAICKDYASTTHKENRQVAVSYYSII